MHVRSHLSLTNRRLVRDQIVNRHTITVRPLISITLAMLLLAASLPPVVAASLTREAAVRSWVAFQEGNRRAVSWLGILKGRSRGAKRGTQQESSTSAGVKPQPPATTSEKEARVAALRINPKGDVTLQTGQSMLFSAIPLDNQLVPIQGLASKWQTSNKEVVSITESGEAVAGWPGQVTLTASAGRITQIAQVTVVEATKDPLGGRKQTSTRSKTTGKQNFDQLQRNTPTTEGDRTYDKRHHVRHIIPTAFLPLPSVDPLPDDESGSLYGPGNGVGSPPGTTKPGGKLPPVAIPGTENGNRNFSFALPVAGLSGRGLGVSLSLVYNSQLWNKSIAPGDSSTWMTYDVDSGWPGPGFRMGFGQIEDQGSFGFTLTDPDGTRHALVGSGNNYDSTDGTFIHYYVNGITHTYTLSYPDGTTVSYGASGGGYRYYPIKITDRNGNYITIAYNGTSGAGPQIDYIQDTLQRYVNFYYASNGDLVTITAPGLTGSSPLQVMRFYYDDVTIPSSGLFGSGVNVSYGTPSTVHTLSYVYLPASSDGSSPQHLGYKFEYSAYGMIYRTTQLRGMTVSSDSTTTAGSVSSEGSQAAQTTYDYPTSASALTDVPVYSHRTDEWAGRTTGGSAPSYEFSGNPSTGVSTVTAPDGTITESHAVVDSGVWDDGLISDIYIQYGSTPTVLTHSHMDWEQDSSSLNPRVYQIRTTDVPAGLTKATVLSYTTYNNVSVASERDFTTDGSVSSTELRRTETTYVNSSSYTGRYLLHLPETVKVLPAGSTTPSARVRYDYDDYGSSHANLTGRSDIIMHDPAFDPFGSSYLSSTDYRGNVTSVTTFADAPGASGTITHSTTYDIAGNVMTAQVDCCQLKSFTYSGAGSGASHDYAYPISVTSGNSSGLHLTTGSTFDYNTGLPATATDENSQETDYSYNSESLRLNSVTYPDGGQTSYGYSDGLGVYAYVVTGAKLDSSHTVYSYRYLDGRGAVARTFNNYTSVNGWSTQDIEYDGMGRAYRASNPYYSSGSGASINPDGFWTTSSFDHLGRVIGTTMPTGDNSTSSTTTVSASFDGVFTTVTDQAGKVRRQKVDAMGRVIRLDEPTSSGLGATSSPNQATNYDYDLLDNLVHINQGSQDRYFKYDSLSRLIREKQVEQETNSSYNLSDAWNTSGAWTRKIDYNSSGLVTGAHDARGVDTTFSYDDLNRTQTITYSDSTPTAHYYYDAQTLPSGAPSSSSPDLYTRTYTTGRLVAMTYGSGATGNYFDYDIAGRVTKQFQITGSTPAKYKLAYDYNLAGMLTSETYPSGRAMAYAYDEGGRLSSVGDGTTTFANAFAYEAHGGLASETFGNAMVHALEYNRRLQANKVKLSQTVSSTTTVLQQYDYGYGEFNTSSGSVDTSKNNGQIGKITGSINGTAQWNQGFTYDELGRLSNVAEHQASAMTTQSYSQGYDYDIYGNRHQSANTTLGLPAVTSSEIVAGTNRFINSGSTPTTYDAAGNITVDTKFRNLKYEYDANGRQNAVKLPDSTSVQTSVYDCAGQRVQTTEGSFVRKMIYDIFGQNVADYLGSSGATLERENIYRGGQLLATNESLSAGAPSALAATPSSSNLALSWTAASGASKYRVERMAAGGSYGLLTTTTGTSTTDSGASSGSAYLYRVCAADSLSNCTSDYSNIALGARLNFTTDATIVSYAEDPATATLIKAAHITELRTAINAVRSLAGQSAGSWTHTGLAAGDLIYADDVRDLRSKLNDALVALNLQTSSYTDNTIVSYADDPLTATVFKAVHIRELRTRSTSGAGNSTSGGSSGGLHYVLSDIQGSTRAVMNNNGSLSAVIARHDYLPFGEEIGSGIGWRSGSQGYATSDTNRWKYGMLQRDATTGLDHAWWRKYESFSGRWTSPDPLSGGISDPQSFNHYSYAANDPVNFVDPSGLSEHPLPKLPPPPPPTAPVWHVNSLPDGWDDLSSILPNWGASGSMALFLFPIPQQSPSNPLLHPVNPIKQILDKAPKPKVDPKKAAWNQFKKICLDRKAKERDLHMGAAGDRIGHAALTGCIWTGTGGAVGGAVVGLVLGAPSGPLDVAPGAIGATVGGIVGCGSGVLGGALQQATLGEYWERRDNAAHLAAADGECNAEADRNSAVK